MKHDWLSPLVGITAAVLLYASGLIPVDGVPWLLIAIVGGWLFARAHSDD